MNISIVCPSNNYQKTSYRQLQKISTYDKHPSARSNGVAMPIQKVETPIDIKSESEKAMLDGLGASFRMNAFSDDELCKIFGTAVETNGKINLDATGGTELTEEQITYFRNKYNVENLSAQEKFDLMRELSDLKVISGKDALGSAVSMVAMPENENGVPMLVTQGTGLIGGKSGNSIATLQSIIDHELYSYSYMLETYEKDVSEVKDSAESHQRVLDVLQLLMRPKKS